MSDFPFKPVEHVIGRFRILQILGRGSEGVVYLAMQGACSGCPSSSATLKNGIEGLLKHFVPEVTEVRAA